MNRPYELIPATASQKIPIIISAPHVGTEIPPSIRTHLNPEMAAELPDTDWFVDRLYEFAPAIGATLIKARYSRYVIDLNRPVEGPALYSDSRLKTDAIPRTSFDGLDLYAKSYAITAADREERIALYYQPYYQALQELITQNLSKFGRVLLWDAHSIRRQVLTIQADPFPDLMLGDRDGHTADPGLVALAVKELSASPYSLAYNHPFKGGQITRFHGQRESGVYAMQLEMSQDIYMSAGSWDQGKADRLKPILQRTLLALVEGMKAL